MRKKISVYTFLIFSIYCSSFVYGAIPAKERAALIALYNSTDGDNWKINYGWKGNNNESDGFSEIGSEGTWFGITVSSDHVIEISMRLKQLSGTIPKELGNLSKLTLLNLEINNLTGIIPPKLGNLGNLTYLGLSSNQLSGNIPPELGNLGNLTHLDLGANKLTGNIPPELGNLSNLSILHLVFNGLSGSIPPELGNLSNLEQLALGYNDLTGSIPSGLGNLSNLTYLMMGSNQLTGIIPPELGNLSLLEDLHLSYNQLTGIPSRLGELHNLKNLSLDHNVLTGIIPPQLGNLSNLNELSLHSNKLTGSIPPQLGNLSLLEELSLYYNQLTGSIPPQLGNLSNLNELSLHSNQLTGSIPPQLGNLSLLKKLILYSNELTGIIPPELENLSKLTHLDLGANKLTGSIPPELGNLSNLTHLVLGGSELTGNIPPELGNLSLLKKLNLYSNQLTGNIPPELGNLSNLEVLALSSNEFTGTIPPELGNFSNLTYLGLSTNELTGTIPPELGNLSLLESLYLSYNQLTGSIPLELGNLSILKYFSLRRNKLTGSIPPELGNLSNLLRFYLSYNNLNGEIPLSLSNLNKLAPPYLDIGYNCLHTNDSVLRAWLNTNDPDWENFQNVCTLILTVQSFPDSGVSIGVYPSDKFNQKDGITGFFRSYEINTKITLTAPPSYNGNTFAKWLINDTEKTNRTIQLTMNRHHSIQAVYTSPSYTLTTQSSPSPGVSITAAPKDANGKGDGNTHFTRTYESGTVVTLSAPTLFNDINFIKWKVNGQDYFTRTIQVTLTSNLNTSVFYDTPNPTEIRINRTSLNFSHVIGGHSTHTERFSVANGGGGTLNWTAITNLSRVRLSPVSGTNDGTVVVSIDAARLNPGKYRGVICVSDPLAINSPVEVELNLWIKAHSLPPFGEFETPLDRSTVNNSIPVTGWALGDTGIESVKIYRGETSNLVYIGDGVLVEGARPDIEAAYPDYPMNHKAGWGYMLLSHFLPNGGNGTFKLHAIATDKEGRTTPLGIKTITIDNKNAVKPFGAIDTPSQGGTASGNKFINWGWVLTPQPNIIPTDGSAIDVWVNGVKLGNPTYNIYRSDIANLFPDYANSNGAIGYYYLDTTAFENGVHTIQWTAKDSAGNSDGIGSRYFTIQNSSGRTSVSAQSNQFQTPPVTNIEGLNNLPINFNVSLLIKRGYREESFPLQKHLDINGTIHIEIRELERLTIQFSEETSGLEGYIIVGKQLKSLPIGSTIDSKTNTFYWQPGFGFFGQYQFVFIEKRLDGEMYRLEILVKISSKFGKNNNVKEK